MDHIFFPAETPSQQAFAPLILTTHVLYRGFQTGAVFGPSLGMWQYARATKASARISRRGGPYSAVLAARTAVIPTLVSTTGTAGVVGAGMLAAGLVYRMWGRSYTEWQDRARRLLMNPWQNEVDKLSVVGMVAGLATLRITDHWGEWHTTNPLHDPRGWRMVAGSMALGSLSGVTVYIFWRYVFKRGRFEKKERRNNAAGKA